MNLPSKLRFSIRRCYFYTSRPKSTNYFPIYVINNCHLYKHLLLSDTRRRFWLGAQKAPYKSENESAIHARSNALLNGTLLKDKCHVGDFFCGNFSRWLLNRHWHLLSAAQQLYEMAVKIPDLHIQQQLQSRTHSAASKHQFKISELHPNFMQHAKPPHKQTAPLFKSRGKPMLTAQFAMWFKVKVLKVWSVNIKLLQKMI